MRQSMRHPLNVAAEKCQIAPDIIIRFVAYEWVIPVDWEHRVLDEEDIARVQLIWELQKDFAVNDEAIPLILHLIDQLNRAHRAIQGGSSGR